MIRVICKNSGMPGLKRKLSQRSTQPRRKYSKYGSSMMRRVGARLNVKRINRKVNKLYSMIETKESCRLGTPNLGLEHNQIVLYGNYNQANYPRTLVTLVNPMSVAQGTDDSMGGVGSRIGDSITVRGLLIRGFFENALGRNRVHYRVMLVRAAKGDTIDRTNLYKGNAANKIIDQVNTERFSIVAQKVFTITGHAGMATTVTAAGVPQIGTIVDSAAQGTKMFSMWIPGKRFGKGGIIRYENGSSTQVKYYDYRIAIMAYDWTGTPQDVNTVGRVNEMYTKLYFKDA